MRGLSPERSKQGFNAIQEEMDMSGMQGMSGDGMSPGLSPQGSIRHADATSKQHSSQITGMPEGGKSLSKAMVSPSAL